MLLARTIQDPVAFPLMIVTIPSRTPMSDDQRTKITPPPPDLTPSDDKQPYLIVVAGRDTARIYPLTTPTTAIGRDPDSTIALEEDSVSRHHARILVDDKRALLKDLGSTNGTYVNDQKITAHALQEGDLIRIGSTVFRFSLQSAIEKDFYDELYQSARFDALTGLMHRGLFQKFIETEFARVRRYKHQLSLLMCDLDNFKEINDQHGHPAGDKVLKAVSKAILSSVRRDVDIPARYGGEEFVILLPETPLEAALKVAERIRQRVANLRIRIPQGSLHVTISIGVSAKDDSIHTPHDLIHSADQKLYLAKQNGKNRVES